MRVFRLLRILAVVWRYRLDEIAVASLRSPALVRVVAWTTGRGPRESRAVRLRRALEELGPIFVKFGQVLSTRRDLLPADIAEELAKLQDRVPPFPSDVAIRELERGLGQPLDDVFTNFEREPVASASVAQVHFARAQGRPHAGKEVAVKVLRPGHAARHRQGPRAARAGGAAGRAAVARRQAAAPARRGRRVRQVPARRARPDARGGQRLAAAPQLRGLATAASCRKCTSTTAPTT